MAAKQSERIRLWGIVQGVGFRPYVAKTADAFGMKGEVLNIGGLVEITVTDTAERISAFLRALIENKPVPAEIVHIKREPIPYRAFTQFTILQSATGGDEAAMIPADLAICPDCLAELYNDANPRYQHPFISCMICGPRYTIIDRIPYDRDNTSMVDFPMCSFCEGEYTDLADRRHHAQTISCHNCGPRLLWKEHTPSGFRDFSWKEPQGASAKNLRETNAPISDTEILNHAAQILADGGVILFKSVGGYNLVADPRNDHAVAKLRHIKNREAKPFAVMFHDMDEIKTFCHVDPIEEKLLESSSRPILLLEHRAQEWHLPDDTSPRQNLPTQHKAAQCELSPSEQRKSRFIGSFLPSFAAQYMLLDRISPLIFTSANLSDMPMIKDDAEAFALMERSNDIDGILYNTRQIRVRADDSVARVIDGQPQMIRRSKGYVPVPLYVNILPYGTDEKTEDSSTPNTSNEAKETAASPAFYPKATVPCELPSVFAAGSQLKNSFALTKGNFVYMSQFFGDMDTVENQQVYEENRKRLETLFRIEPSVVACDLHPLYFTTHFAESYARQKRLPLIQVQHHHAHVASVMAENDLRGKVIGISFDGTGYGTDGNIWGGEFFLCEGGNARRIAHLPYVDMLGGDASVKDAVRSALSYIHAYDNGMPDAGSLDISDIIAYGKERLLQTQAANLVLPALRAGINTVKSSSMGRLFDAVSALLGIKDYNDYEGQCAILLEDAAAFALKHPGQRENCDLALAFHQRIIDMIVLQCRSARTQYKTGQVALTGGTFQNKILMEGVLEKLRADGFQPYYNISVSPNDGGIALGQAYVAMHEACRTDG